MCDPHIELVANRELEPVWTSADEESEEIEETESKFVQLFRIGTLLKRAEGVVVRKYI